MDLGFAGEKVTGQESGYTVALVLGGYEVRIETPFVLRRATGDVEVTPGETDLPDLAGHEVTVARADDQGGLRIDFTDGSRLLVAADEDYEAWTVAGPDGLKVVSEPGGALAVWGAE